MMQYMMVIPADVDAEWRELMAQRRREGTCGMARGGEGAEEG